jgi:caffeoyl-CoA O-methyltransferase
MTRRSLGLTDELQQYLVEHSTQPDKLQLALVEETAALGGAARMQIGPEQGQLLTMITQMVGARFAVEVGTFTGYSSICIARGLSPRGRLLCCDVSEEWTATAQRYWKSAGLDKRIELRLGPALETLQDLPDKPHVDLAFIDADKGGYIDYWEELVPRMRTGGVILVDNVLWSGRVVDPSINDADTKAIREFNDHAAADGRVELVVLPLSDGLTVARRNRVPT